MNKLFRLIIWLSAGFVILLILAFIGFKLFFPVEKMIALAVDEADKRFNRTVEIADIELSIWGGLGFQLVDVVVKGKDSSETDLLTAEDIDLKLSLLPLFSGDYRVDRLIINSPNINIINYGDGTTNLPNMINDSLAQIPPEGQAAGVVISFDLFEINNANINYFNKDELDISLQGFNLTSHLEDETENLYVSSGAFSSENIIVFRSAILKSFPLGGNYNLTYDLLEKKLTISNSQVTFGNVKINFDLKADHSNNQITITSNINSRNIESSDIESLFTDSVTKKISDFELGGSFSFTTDINYSSSDTTALKYNGEISFRNLSLVHKELQGKLLLPKVTVHIENDNFRLNSQDGQFNDKPFKIHMAIRDFKNPEVTGEVAGDIDLLFLKPLLPKKYNQTLSGEAHFDLKISGQSEKIEDLNYFGNFNLSNGKYNADFLSQPVELVEGNFYVDKHLLRVDSLVIKTKSNSLEFSGRIMNLVDFLTQDSLSTTKSELLVDGKIKGEIELSSVSTYLPKKGNPKIEGSFLYDIEISGSYSKPEKMIKTGKMSFVNVSYNDDFLNEPLLDFDAEMSITPDTISFTKMSAKFNSGDLSFEGKLSKPFPYLLPFRDIDRSNMVKPNFKFVLTSKKLNLDQMFPEASLGGTEDSVVKISDSVSMLLLPDINGSGTFRFDTLIYSEVQFTAIKGDIKIYDRIVDCSNVVGMVYQGDITGSTKIDFNDITNPSYSGKFRANHVEADNFFTQFTPLKSVVYGKMDLEGNYSASGWEKESFINSLSMKSDINLLEGRIEPTGNILNSITKFTNLIKESPDIVKKFKRMTSQVIVKDGKVILQNLKAKLGSLGDIELSGNYDFDDNIDLKGTLLLSKSITEKLLSRNDLIGGLSSLLSSGSVENIKLPVTISGTVNNPVMKIDINPLSSKIKDNIKDQATDLLKKLFKK